MFVNFYEIGVLFEKLHTSASVRLGKNVVKSRSFWSLLRLRAQPFCWNEGAVEGVLCKNIFVVDLLRSQYLFEILQTSLTVKNSENGVKRDVLKNVSIFLSKWRKDIKSLV